MPFDSTPSSGNCVESVQAQVEENATHSQTDSPLFRLPTEVRVLIYEYLFGTGTIHIAYREKIPPDVFPYPEEAEPLRPTYTICQKPHDWTRSYTLSKTPSNFPDEYFRHGDNDSLRFIHGQTPPDVLQRYFARHSDCQEPFVDFVWQDYVNFCKHNEPWGRHKKPSCEACAIERQRLRSVYGPPLEGGLKRLHAGTALGLAILSTCRLIYFEARSLPFALYEFDALGPTTLVDLTLQCFVPWQVAAIQTIHVQSNGTLNDATKFLALLDIAPNLKYLRISSDRAFTVHEEDEGWKEFSQRSKIDSVEIIFGWDGIRSFFGKGSDRVDQRLDNRKAAQKAEKFLIESSANHVDCASDMPAAVK